MEERSNQYFRKYEKYDYLGFGRFPSHCGLEIIQKGNKYIVILTELEDNEGTSVTNAIEDIATQIKNTRLANVNANDIIFIEHYEKIFDDKETYDVVTLSYDEQLKRYFQPRWNRISDIQEFINSIGE